MARQNETEACIQLSFSNLRWIADLFPPGGADLMVPKQLGLWPSIPHHGHHGSVSPFGGAVAELSFVQLFRLVGWVGDGDDVMDKVAIECKGGSHLPVGSLFMSQLLLL